MGCLPLSHNHHDRDRQTDPESSTPSLFSESTYCKCPTAAIPTFFLQSIKNFPAGKLLSFSELEYVPTAQIKHFNYGRHSGFTQWSIYCVHSCNRFWSHLKTSSKRAVVFLMEKLLDVYFWNMGKAEFTAHLVWKVSSLYSAPEENRCLIQF